MKYLVLFVLLISIGCGRNDKPNKSDNHVEGTVVDIKLVTGNIIVIEFDDGRWTRLNKRWSDPIVIKKNTYNRIFFDSYQEITFVSEMNSPVLP